MKSKLTYNNKQYAWVEAGLTVHNPTWTAALEAVCVHMSDKDKSSHKTYINTHSVAEWSLVKLSSNRHHLSAKSKLSKSFHRPQLLVTSCDRRDASEQNTHRLTNYSAAWMHFITPMSSQILHSSCLLYLTHVDIQNKTLQFNKQAAVQLRGIYWASSSSLLGLSDCTQLSTGLDFRGTATRGDSFAAPARQPRARSNFR